VEGDPAGVLRRRLEDRGLTVNVVVAAHQGDHVADWLRDEARQAGCDLIVMGLYGHTRVREFVLGGVSRSMLHEPVLPLLISH
jgi:nucleotide-binding universal stress UspA family protein